MRADLILGLAEAWHCPPSQVLEEDASWLRAMHVRNLGRPDQPESEL
jgi:hypothetical protein